MEILNPEKSDVELDNDVLLYPLLFSIYAEMMMIDAMEDVEEWVRVEFKFADDQRMVSQTE